MPDNTTGPVRDDRTEKPTVRPAVAEPAGTAVPGAATPMPGGAVKEQAPGRGEPVGTAAQKQAPGRGTQLDAKPVPEHTAADRAPAKEAAVDDTGSVLFGADTATVFRTRWREVQADFVDDPARAVRGADELVDEVLKQLSETLAKHKHGLEGGWQDRGETEELRVALRKYRSFFDQLLKT